MKPRHFYLAGIIAIVGLAFFLRIYDINHIPAGIYPDESVNGTDAINAIESGNYQLFYENNYGREGLFINLQAFSILLFGNTIFGLKIIPILFGTLTALGTYLLARELFVSRFGGIIASFLVAVSYWAINFSRIGFRANFVPLLLVFSFYFFFAGLRLKKNWLFVTSGLLFGLGLHTYIAFRIAPLVLIVLIPALIAIRKKFLQTYWKFALIFIFSAFISAAPMLWNFFISNPEHFESRSNAISVLSSEVNHGDFWGTLTRSFSLALAKYIVWGDQNWRHNHPPYPILDPVSSFAFVVGFCIALYKVISITMRRALNNDRARDLVIFLFLLTWFFALLAPEFFTSEGNPHALRSIGTIPAVYILAAYPILLAWRRLRKSTGQIMASCIVFFFLGIAGAWNTYNYFGAWAQTPESHSAFDERYTQIAYYLNVADASNHLYVITNGHGRDMDDGFPVSAHVIEYFTHGKSKITLIKPGALPDNFPSPGIIVLMDHSDTLVQDITTKFPSARVEHVTPYAGCPEDTKFTVLFLNNPQ